MRRQVTAGGVFYLYQSFQKNGKIDLMSNIIRNARIIGTGRFLPERIITNEYLESIVSTDADWVSKTLGIKERRFAHENQATSDLAWRAGMNAVLDAKIKVQDIDLIIVATSTPDRIAPSTACIVQEKMKAYQAVAFDISAVCSGFLFAMSVAAQYISSRTYDHILVIGADTFSKITDMTRRDSVFFGDGAGAAVLSYAKSQEGFLTFQLYSDGRGKNNFTVPAGGSELPTSTETLQNRLHYFKMDGHEVFKTAVNVLPKAINQVLKAAGLTIDDVDLLIPHQPSIGILKETAKIIKLPFGKVMTNMDRYANTSGGTIPIMLDEANRAGKLHHGSTILFAAVGAGWTWGAAIAKWTEE
jgi:3-oxoacyl-[acyl-carrier-protein] synthase III